MAELWYGHFDSTPEDERLLLAADWARFIASCVTNGIRNGGDCLRVTSENTGMTVRVDNGIACIMGYIMQLETNHDGRYFPVTIPEAHPQQPRIDRLVLRLDRRIQTRNIRPVISIGVAGQSPEPPPLVRTNDIWELSLAQIRVNANAVNITDANITDERFDTELCGLMNSILGLDPSVWQEQFDAFMGQLDVDNDEFVKRSELMLEELKALFTDEFDRTKNNINVFFKDIEDIWREWFGKTTAEPGIFLQRNFDNPAIYPGSTKWRNRIDSTTTLEEIRAGRLEDGALIASRKIVTKNRRASVEYIFYSPHTGEVVSHFIEHFEHIDTRKTKNYIEVMI